MKETCSSYRQKSLNSYDSRQNWSQMNERDGILDLFLVSHSDSSQLQVSVCGRGQSAFQLVCMSIRLKNNHWLEESHVLEEVFVSLHPPWFVGVM